MGEKDVEGAMVRAARRVAWLIIPMVGLMDL